MKRLKFSAFIYKKGDGEIQYCAGEETLKNGEDLGGFLCDNRTDAACRYADYVE